MIDGHLDGSQVGDFEVNGLLEMMNLAFKMMKSLLKVGDFELLPEVLLR